MIVPIFMKPVFKDYIWGGTNIKQKLNKNTPYEKTAESWEVSTNANGKAEIINGDYEGKTLYELFEDKNKREELFGTKTVNLDRFPLLVKYIDAESNLSVQVHPNDEYASNVENDIGKTEMWYIMDCKPGAKLICGTQDGIKKDDVEKNIKEGTVEKILNYVDVNKGDVIYIPSGTIHAIMEGLLICEIQQNSNSTYRLYDYDRRDKNGKPRELHMDKAMDVVNTNRFVINTQGVGETIKYARSEQRLLCECKYFEVKYYDIPKHEIIMVDDSSFKSIVVIEGSCKITCGDEEETANNGDTFFIAAGRKRVHINGQCKLLVTNI